MASKADRKTYYSDCKDSIQIKIEHWTRPVRPCKKKEFPFDLPWLRQIQVWWKKLIFFPSYLIDSKKAGWKFRPGFYGLVHKWPSFSYPNIKKELFCFAGFSWRPVSVWRRDNITTSLYPLKFFVLKAQQDIHTAHKTSESCQTVEPGQFAVIL